VGKEEKNEFEHKAPGRGGVNFLEEAGRELVEARFEGFIKVLQQRGFVRLVQPPAAFLAGLLLTATRPCSRCRRRCPPASPRPGRGSRSGQLLSRRGRSILPAHRRWQ